MSSWQLGLAVCISALVLWLGLVAALGVFHRQHPEATRMQGTLRLMPDLLGLLRRLAADRDLPSGVRLWLGLLMLYLLMPIDLIPDFIPVVGYADDAIIVALALRAVVRRAGTDAVAQHWSGTSEGLAIVRRLAGLR